MYDAKSSGKNQYELFHQDMHQDESKQMMLETYLRKALERNELYLVYHPIVDTESLEIVSVEALVRWKQKTLGDIPPSEFIPLAEETGLIVDRFSAMTLLHEEAIYLHQGTQFQVELLDWEEKKAFVREVDVDYYTDANLAVQLKVLEQDKQQSILSGEIGYGDVSIIAMATIFKKIKFETHENIGSGGL